MKGSNSAKEHRRRCLLGRPRLFSPHALQGGMRSRLQWRLCWSCRVMSTPPECFSLSLSLTCTYITEQKTRACHMPPVILQVKFTQDLSGSQKKNRRWRAVISQGKKGWSPTTFSIHCRQTRHALWQISQHLPEMRQGTSAQNENRFVIPAASLSGGLSARIPTNGVL